MENLNEIAPTIAELGLTEADVIDASNKEVAEKVPFELTKAKAQAVINDLKEIEKNNGYTKIAQTNKIPRNIVAKLHKEMKSIEASVIVVTDPEIIAEQEVEEVEASK